MHVDGRKFRVASQARFRRVDDEMVVVLQDKGEVTGLNATAADIVELLATDAQRVVDVVAALVSKYSEEASVIAADVAELIEMLLLAGVLVLVDGDL